MEEEAGPGCCYIYTLYDHPRDHPGAYVARRFRIEAGQSIREALVGWEYSLALLRSDLPLDAICLGRHPQDEPQIVESWLSFTRMPDLAS